MSHKKKFNKPKDILDEQQRIVKKIGSRIKQLRLAAGHTSQEQFAYSNDLDRSQLGKYERGESDMRISSLVKIFIALDVTPTEFFKGME